MAVATKKRGKKFPVGKAVFICVMLSYSVIHFAIVWGYVNMSAISLTFTQYSAIYGRFYFVFLENYKTVVKDIATMPHIRTLVVNSFFYFPVTCFISLPLSILFSYFLFKKMPAANVFRVIFYLPSILPIAVLTMAFRYAFGSNGIVDPILKFFGFSNLPIWWGSSTVSPIMIFVYCVWAGLGFNIVLLSGAMSRVPQELVEYNRLEGLGLMKELFLVMIPLIWPTIVTTFVLGMSSVLTVYLQPYFLMERNIVFNTGTISSYIFVNYASQIQTPYLSAFGLFCTIVFVPFILLTRWFLNKFNKDVDY